MLKITRYLGILVVIVSVGGLWYPKLGYFLVLIFAALLIISPFRGRWFCGNLCPRGSFNDFWVGKISKRKKIPKFFGNIWIRTAIFVLLMGIMGLRLISTKGAIDLIGMVFVIMCLATTSIALLFGIFFSPRAWCTFCPMGTAQRFLGGKRYQLKTDTSRCVNCGLCSKECPMQLPVNTIAHKPDCIKCSRCISICPKKAISFAG